MQVKNVEKEMEREIKKIGCIHDQRLLKLMDNIQNFLDLVEVVRREFIQESFD